MPDEKPPRPRSLEQIPDENSPPPKPITTVVRELNQKLEAIGRECHADGQIFLCAWALESRKGDGAQVGFVGLVKPLTRAWLHCLAIWDKLISQVVLDDVEIKRAPMPPPPPSL